MNLEQKMTELRYELHKKLNFTRTKAVRVQKTWKTLHVSIEDISNSEDIELTSFVEQSLRELFGYGTLKKTYDSKKHILSVAYKPLAKQEPVAMAQGILKQEKPLPVPGPDKLYQ